MEPKKISFGFSKIQKKSNILAAPPAKEENKIELIKCLEGQEIQLVEEKPVEEEKPLVIPLIGATRTSAALASLKARHDALNGINSSLSPAEDKDKTEKCEPVPDVTETLEQKAARELLESVNKTGKTDDGDTATIVIPKPDELPLEGAKESSMDDYDSTPIDKFGYAMLRGMGWKEEPKKKEDGIDLSEPFVRPRGMGLGADKIVKKKPPLIPPESNEVLQVKRNACVRILAGKHKDLYGVIEGFDEHAGRVIVKLALGGHYESLNEFLVQAVSKKEYAQYGKVINSAKYEEYKKLENEHGQIVLKAPKIEKTSDDESNDRKPIIKQEKYSSQATSSRRYSNEYDEKSRDRRDRLEYQSRDDRRDRRDKHDDNRRRNNDNISRRRSCSSDDSPSSQSSDEDRRHRVKKKSSKSKKKHKEQSRDRHRRRSRSRQRYSSSEDEKRHKKKTKKSKRPRSRSRERKR